MISPARPNLKFANENEVLADVARLRRGFTPHGNWTLAQIAWHVVIPLEQYLNSPQTPDAKPTPEQAAMQARFVDYIVETGHVPPHARTAPPSWTPPPTAGDGDIARLEAGLHKLKGYPHALVEMGPLGPVAIAKCRLVHLVHAAHHLSFLEPTAPQS